VDVQRSSACPVDANDTIDTTTTNNNNTKNQAAAAIVVCLSLGESCLCRSVPIGQGYTDDVVRHSTKPTRCAKLPTFFRRAARGVHEDRSIAGPSPGSC
jgi:hypothetical protein